MTEFFYRARPRPKSLSEGLRVVGDLVSYGEARLGYLSLASRDLDLIIQLRERVRPFCQEVSPLNWRYSEEGPTAARVAAVSEELLEIALKSGQETTITMHIDSHLEGAPVVSDSEYCQSVAYLQSENWRGSFSVLYTDGRREERPRDFDAFERRKTAFYRKVFEFLAIPVVVELEPSAGPWEGLRLVARTRSSDIAVSTTSGDAVTLTPTERGDAASWFRTVRDQLIDELYNLSVTLGGEASPARRLAALDIVPLTMVSFMGYPNRDAGLDAIEDLASRADVFSFSWWFRELGGQKDLDLDVKLALRNEEYELEVHGTHHEEEEAAVAWMQREYGLPLEHWYSG